MDNAALPVQIDAASAIIRKFLSDGVWHYASELQEKLAEVPFAVSALSHLLQAGEVERQVAPGVMRGPVIERELVHEDSRESFRHTMAESPDAESGLLARVLYRLATSSSPTPAGDDQSAVTVDATPKNYLFGWSEILDAVGLKNNNESRNRVQRLNNQFDGPILSTGKGSQSRVEKSKLIAWWNGLEARVEELARRETDKQATVEDQHGYGRDGVVVPGISGGVKRRRNGTSHKVTKGNKRS